MREAGNGFTTLDMDTRSQIAFLDALLHVKHKAGLEKALRVMLDALSHWEFAFSYVCDILPSVLIRLDRDLQCYMFIKAFRKCELHGNDLTSVATRIRNSAGEDPLDDISYILAFPYSLLDRLSCTLVKIRLLRHLHNLRKSNLLTGLVPPEILALIRGHIVEGSSVAKTHIANLNDQAEDIQRLEEQIKELYEHVEAEDPQIWRAMIMPRRKTDWSPDPPCRTIGPSSSIVVKDYKRSVIVHRQQPAWLESPGALKMIQNHILRRGQRRRSLETP